jgi:hypothetical protein
MLDITPRVVLLLVMADKSEAYDSAARSLTPPQAHLVDAVLRNNEVSSDEELVEYFVENGLTEDVALALAAVRDDLIGRI